MNDDEDDREEEEEEEEEEGEEEAKKAINDPKEINGDDVCLRSDQDNKTKEFLNVLSGSVGSGEEIVMDENKPGSNQCERMGPRDSITIHGNFLYLA
jgi:hypothetical protein